MMDGALNVSPLDLALELADTYGWHVFPMKLTPKGDGKHKKIYLAQWGSEATNDADLIERLNWQEASHVGVSCKPSGVWVVDEDKPGATDGLNLPETLIMDTPRGRHFVYQQANFDQRNTQADPAPAVDIRANGGMFVCYGNVIHDADIAPWPFNAPIGGAPKRPSGGPQIAINSGAFKGVDDYRQQILSASIDGEKHKATRDIAASLAAQGIKKEFAVGLIQAICPVWDKNLINSIESAYQKFTPEAQWPEPDMSVLAPSRPPAPEMTEDEFAMVYGPWAEWLNSAAAAKGAPVDYVAMALLTTASAAIGNSRRVCPWDGWSEPCTLWAMAIGDPSSGKSPALDAILDPVREIEKGYAEAYKAARQEWDAKDELARLSLTAWKADAKAAIAEGDDAPPKPESADPGPMPVRDRIRISDATTEKVAELIASTWRGLLLSRDELAGWLGGMDRYNGGGDRPFWLEAYGGRAFTIDRKSNPEPIIVDHLSVAVLGGTQPDKLESLLVKSDDDGMLARFMTVFPEPRPISRPTAAIDNEKMETAISRLRGLQPAVDDKGSRRPFFLNLTDRAADVFDTFRQQCRKWEREASGPYKGHIGKLSGMALRLSCVLAHLDWAASETALGVTHIDEAHIGRACHLVGEHLRLHAYRAYGTIKPPAEVQGARIIASIIRDERMTLFKVRDIQHRERSGLQTSSAVTAALRVLLDSDWLREVRDSTGGRPSVSYAVNPRLGGKL